MESKDKAKEIIKGVFIDVLDCNEDEAESVTDNIIEKIEEESIEFTEQRDGVLVFELRGDEEEIIESIKSHIPSVREDIWSWLCYFQGEIKEQEKLKLAMKKEDHPEYERLIKELDVKVEVL